MIDSNVQTVCKTGGIFTFGRDLDEPFLVSAGETAADYIAMNKEDY